MRSRIICILLILLAFGCESEVVDDDLQVNASAIINGRPVTGDNHMNVVSLGIMYDGQYYSTCTGTLIMPNVVLTAAHCVNPSDNPYWDSLVIGVGHHADDMLVYDVKSIHEHPDLTLEENTDDPFFVHDIAVILLEKAVPLSIAQPAMPIMPDNDISDSDIERAEGVMVNLVGFGVREPDNVESAGDKYETNVKVLSRCSRISKEDCSDTGSKFFPGHMLLNSRETGSCYGDSGGPAFYTIDGKEYIIGVAFFGTSDRCDEEAAYIIVSDYIDFIESIAGKLMSNDPEDCSNKQDDNGDGRIDCADPWCYGEEKCVPEDSFNQVNGNGNDFIDSKDSESSESCAAAPRKPASTLSLLWLMLVGLFSLLRACGVVSRRS